jgi:hypothetical protein
MFKFTAIISKNLQQLINLYLQKLTICRAPLSSTAHLGPQNMPRALVSLRQMTRTGRESDKRRRRETREDFLGKRNSMRFAATRHRLNGY